MDHDAAITIGSIKKYLKDFKILSKWTTFNGALQLALSVSEPFDEKRVREGLVILGQSDSEGLVCAYCGRAAKTWDHLFNNVQRKRFSGYGNRIPNLVPACRNCNERKSSKDWKAFASEVSAGQARTERLEAFAARTNREAFNWDEIEKEFPLEAQKYQELIDKVHQALKEADVVAAGIRTLVRTKLRERGSSTA